MRKTVNIRLPKSALWKTFHNDQSPYLRALVDSFYEWLQDEIDARGYSLYHVVIEGTQVLEVEYGYDPEYGEPEKIVTDGDIEIYWSEYVDKHISEWGGGQYEEAAEFALAEYQKKILQCRKSIKQHKQMMELYNVNQES